MYVVTGGAASNKMAQWADIVAVLWVVEGGGGQMPAVSDCKHVCHVAVRWGLESRLLLEHFNGDLWTLRAAAWVSAIGA